MGVRTGSEVICGRTVALVGMDDDAHLLELFEVPIDRRQGDVGSLRLDHLGQSLCGPMTRSIEEGVEEKPP